MPDDPLKNITYALRGIDDTMTNIKKRKLADLESKKLQFELESYNQTLPEGFVMVGGKAVKDPTYLNPIQQMESKMYAQALGGVDAGTKQFEQPRKNQFNADGSATPMKVTGFSGGKPILGQDPEDWERKKQEIKYNSPQNVAAREKESQAIKDTAADMLEMITSAKRGERFFGRFGNLPTYATKEFFNNEEYSDRRDWETNVNRLLATKVIDIMNRMKSASRTGATGFGQLNKSELQLLKDSSTALKRDLPGELAIQHLNNLERLYKKIVDGDVTQGQGVGLEQGGSQPGVPSWVPQGLENQYQDAVRFGYSDEEIRSYLSNKA